MSLSELDDAARDLALYTLTVLKGPIFKGFGIRYPDGCHPPPVERVLEIVGSNEQIIKLQLPDLEEEEKDG